MSKDTSPDQVIEDMGGCGRYQTRLCVVVHLVKTAICWSILTMVVASKTPDWKCADLELNNSNENSSRGWPKICNAANNTPCDYFEFDPDITTIVTSFHLVCEYDFIPSTIMSLQLVGMMIGNPLSGQLADLLGRKTPFFLSLLLLVVFNLLAVFSSTWIMFTIARVFIGIGCAFFLTVQYSLLSEFSPAMWRPWIIGFPSWPLQACLFALVAWLLHDWKYLHLTNAIIAGVCLASWWVVPESFRWYLAHEKTERAQSVIQSVAKMNGKAEPDLTKLAEAVKKVENPDQKYTFFHLFKSRYLIKVTLLSAINWLALGFVSYGLTFGIQALSGNMFLNLFLFSATGIPVKMAVAILQNKIGRRTTSIICYVITGIGGFTAAFVQYIDTEYRGMVTNWSAIFANMGITGAWGSVQTMTIEMYPTVIRNIGFGALSVTGRIGAVVGPQMVYLETKFPGTMYFICGGLSTLSVIGFCFLPETKHKNLNDKIQQTREVTPA